MRQHATDTERRGARVGAGPTRGAASGAPPSAREWFRPEIQGLRGVAVLLVVIYHSRLGLSGGFVGVDVFFVISGFVITQMLLRELDATGTIGLRRFYERRIRRLLPAMALVTGVTLAAAVFVISPNGPQQFAARTGRAASLFTANFNLYRQGGGYFDPSEDTNPFLHMWSLSVEEQFYLMMPMTILLAWRLGRRRASGRNAVTAVIAVVAGMAALSLAASAFWSFDRGFLPFEARSRFAFYGPFARVWEFGLGVLLAIGVERLARLDRRVANGFAVAGVAAIGFASVQFDQTTVFPGLAAVVPVVGTGLLIAASTASSRVRGPLGWAPLVAIGDLSYAWYLWHWPVIVMTRVLWPRHDLLLVAAAVVSLLPAFLSHRFVEAPVRRNRRIVGGRAFGLAAGLVAVPVALSFALGYGASRTWWILGPSDAAAQAVSTSNRDGCVMETRRHGCLYPVPGSRAKVVLVGDSHADAISDAMRGAALANRASYGVWSPGGCLFLSTVSTSEGCRRWQTNALSWIRDEKPDAVILAGYTTGRLTGTNSGRRTPIEMLDGKGRRASSEERAIALYAQGLDEAVSKLERAGIGVIVISAVPDFDHDPFESWSLVRRSPTGERVTVNDARRRVAPVVAAERAVAARHPRLHLLDPIPYLCDRACAQYRAGAWQYRDTDHLTLLGADRLRPPISALIRRVLDRGGLDRGSPP